MSCMCIKLFRKFPPFFYISVFRTIECSNAASWPAKMALSLSRASLTLLTSLVTSLRLIDLNNQYSI